MSGDPLTTLLVPEPLFAAPEAAAAIPLTRRQQAAYDYVRTHDGVTTDEIGASLHAHRDRRPHPADERCEWCARDGAGVVRSKALAPLVTYRRTPGGRRYIARNPADRPAEPDRGQRVSRQVDGDPFEGL